MNKEIENLIEQIVLAIEKVTPNPVPEEALEKIRTKCSFLATIPEFHIFQNPKEFDEYARIKQTDYKGTFGDQQKSHTNSDILCGDYVPGTSRFKDCSRVSEMPIEYDDISNFSMNRLQIVLSTDIYDEFANTLIIYIPEQKEWEETSFSNFVKNEYRQALFQDIYKAVKETISSEEIWKIVNALDFSNGVPEIRVISDPHKFDEVAIRREEVYSDSFENDNSLSVETKTLFGDYAPGITETFEKRKYRSLTNEAETASDFSLNSPQVAFVKTYKNCRFYNSVSEQNNSEIIIYLPEKEYEEQTYKEYIEKRTHSIVETVSFIKSYIPQIDPEKLQKKFTPTLESLIKKCDEILEEKLQSQDEGEQK